MNIAKASFLSLISTVVKMLSGLLINKVISVFIGASGLAVIGQLQNASGIIQTLSSGGISNGVIKYTAENKDNDMVWSTSLIIILFFSIIASIILFLFSGNLSVLFFNSVQYKFIFTLFGCTVIIFSLNQFILNIISGLGEIKFYTVINIIQSVYSLIFTIFLTYTYSLNGALIAMVTNQAIVFFIVLYKLKDHNEIKLKRFFNGYDKKKAIKLFNYTLMTFISALSLPIALILIRNYIGSNLSWDYAGYWQAINYISSMCFLVITTILTTYYLPKLSKLSSNHDIIKEVKKTAIFIIPITILGAISIYACKNIIVSILFSHDFIVMVDLFKWQLVGDVIKVASCLLSYMLLAKTMTKVFIITEIFSAITLTVLSILCVNYYGFIGLSYAYALSNGFYFIIITFVIIKYFFIRNKELV